MVHSGSNPEEYSVIVLGTAQDGGYPHTGCNKKCCADAWSDQTKIRLISSIAIIQESTNKCWLIDITPDFKNQIRNLYKYLSYSPDICGIFITHAHKGHYTGLLELGLEAMDTQMIPIYAMDRMRRFLLSNEPFATLVKSKNIELKDLSDLEPINITSKLSIVPFIVPHRNELSETVGYKIIFKSSHIIYIPDIDSWDGFEDNIKSMINTSTVSIIDGTFYSDRELDYRNMSLVQHPTIVDSMKLFSDINHTNKKKIFFTHLNHTNPTINPFSDESLIVQDSGYNIAEDGKIFKI